MHGIECHYYGKIGHMARYWYKKQNDVHGDRVQHGDYASSSNKGHTDHLFCHEACDGYYDISQRE